MALLSAVLLSILLGASGAWRWILTTPPRLQVRQILHASPHWEGLAAELAVDVSHEFPFSVEIEGADIVTTVEGVALTEARLSAVPVVIPAGQPTSVRVRVSSRWGAVAQTVLGVARADHVRWRVDGTVRARALWVSVPVPLHAEGVFPMAALRETIERHTPTLPRLPSGWTW